MYRYDRLVQPVGHPEETGRRDKPYSATVSLNMQPMKILTRWFDELPDSAGTFDRESLVSREYAQYGDQSIALSPPTTTTIKTW